MIEINLPEVLSELNKAFRAYELALTTSDIATLNDLFWDSEHTLRYGIREGERQYSYDEIVAFRLRRGAVNQRRVLRNLRIITFGRNLGVANTEFLTPGSSRVGRQSQTWLRTEQGWKIVGAHVSIEVTPTDKPSK